MPAIYNVLVTGGSGFVGRHVLERLGQENVFVTIISRKHLNNKSLLGLYNKEVILDINNTSDDIYTITGKPDLLIHLAWGGLPNYQSNHHCEKELHEQHSFLKKMIDSGIKRILITGTCYEYGLQEGKVHESHPLIPVTQYGIAKKKLHEELMGLLKDKNTILTWCRLFYLWGEGQNKSSLYTQLSNAIRENHTEFNMSLGEQKRDFLHVAQVSDYLVKLALNNDCTNTFNIGSGEAVTINELVNNWKEINNSNIKLNRGVYPYPKHEPFEFWANIERLTRFLEQHEKNH